jgi:hypothetical protein
MITRKALFADVNYHFSRLVNELIESVSKVVKNSVGVHSEFRFL